jgi:hypothetical protein
MFWYIVGGALLAAAFWSFAAWRASARARGLRVVHCPATHGSASLRLRMANLFSIRGPEHLVVTECSEWPARKNCAQDCLAEIAASPEHCGLRRLLATWYRSQRCAFCGREVPEVHWGDLRPALLAPDGELVEWPDIRPERLYEVLATHRAVCASCDVAEVFRRCHAEWVVERPRAGDDRPLSSRRES